MALLWICSSSSMSFDWGHQTWMLYWRWGLTRAELKRRISSLELLVTLLLIQPRIPLAFWAVSAHCCFCLVFHQPSSPAPSASLQGSIHFLLSLDFMPKTATTQETDWMALKVLSNAKASIIPIFQQKNSQKTQNQPTKQKKKPKEVVFLITRTWVY